MQGDAIRWALENLQTNDLRVRTASGDMFTGSIKKYPSFIVVEEVLSGTQDIKQLAVIPLDYIESIQEVK